MRFLHDTADSFSVNTIFGSLKSSSLCYAFQMFAFDVRFIIIISVHIPKRK